MSGPDAIRIRDAETDDHGPIRELTLRAYAEYQAEMEPAAWNALDTAVRSALDDDRGAQQIVAELNGRLVGSVRLYPPSVNAYRGAAGELSWPELRLLAVAPAARGHGIARRLVEECIRRAHRMGATSIGLHTSRSMRAAARLYEQMGFVRAQEHDFQPPGAERVEAYRLRLPYSGS